MASSGWCLTERHGDLCKSYPIYKRCTCACHPSSVDWNTDEEEENQDEP